MTSNPRRLVIVESPTKAQKIASYLGSDYVVESSRGHIRDLPTGASEVPAKYKKEPWARTGVDVEHDFAPLYVVSSDKKSTIKNLKGLLKEVDELYLATDGDREGEAIAWHLLQELKPKIPVKRMVFHEITREAIEAAVENPRMIDEDLVDAQETRRILDRLYGYEVSPVLWKKVMPKLSAGRVQSVATRLVVDRERERMAFQPARYCSITATCDAGSSAIPRLFEAKVVALDDGRLANGRDFDSQGHSVNDVIVLDEQMAERISAALRDADHAEVVKVDAKPYTRRPAAPFRTTTLQQEAGRKLGFSTDRTMRVAQQLYESGYITYMRTDSIELSQEAIAAARDQIRSVYGADYLPSAPRIYASKVKNAQEAHEAIRPAGSQFKTPDGSGLSGDQLKLYTLIWQRTIASQMCDAQGKTVSISLQSSLKGCEIATAHLSCAGRTITFPGFMKAYVEGKEENDEAKLPALHVGDYVVIGNVDPQHHQTKPPARYTEPSLIATLEELEIGRPSTYASIIRTITARDYVYKKGSALVPTWLAFAVTRLLVEHFYQLVDYQFTADLEDKLDEIARGDAQRLKVLKDFFYGDSSQSQRGLHEMVDSLGDIDAKALSTFPIPSDEHHIDVRVGRYGTYLEDDEGNRANVPDDLCPDELTEAKALELLSEASADGRELGIDPSTQTMIVAKNGRYGPYVTEILGDDADAKAKPRTASLFKTMTLSSVTLDEALRLLSLPRTVGVDDEGVEIVALNGRFGPYIKRGSDSRTLPDEESLFTITVEQAKELLLQPRGKRAAAASGPLRTLGIEQSTGKELIIKDGRFGPYITDGEYNVTVPKAKSVESITLDEAIDLIVAKRAKGPAVKRARKTATKKKSSTSSTAKKSVSKKK